MKQAIKWLNTPWLEPNPNQRSMGGVVLLGVLVAIPIGVVLGFGIYPAGVIAILSTLFALLLWHKSGIANVL